MTSRRSAGVCFAFTLVASAPLAAQTSPQLGFFAGAMGIRVRDGTAAGVQTLTSTLPAGEATISLSRFLLEGAYAQGSLTPETPAPARDYVEGKVMAGILITRSLSLKGGAHARSYVLPGGTRRRLFWEARAAFETPVSGQVAAAHLELWAAFAGESNLDEKLDHARGGEAALLLHLPRSPLWGKLGYRVERAQFDAASRGETIEGLFLTLGVGLPGH